ncbi:hypothetical protein GTA08_BOTSDO11146 [Neofusicoccum parvum]|nr:hypothetical protein GTA08_BOTSDO11146 [Neofusicoccum parvum]
MWDDEDNNPYGSFERHDSSPSQVGHFGSPGGFRPMTPPSEASSPPFGSPEYINHRRDLSDVEYDDEPQPPQRIEPKKGGYDSRIEQILYENPELPILITDAGKSAEGGGKYIVYAIRTGDLEVRRRYSEFASLRNTLVNLHPTLIIPPIPEKHTTADYVAKPMKAKEDVGIIELRKRMLAVFLNRCRRMQEVREDGVWWRFLDPNVSWAIEKMGQAVDSTYIQTAELSSALSAGFAEPMRESAQFAGIVRDVLRYRILKRVQEEMAKDELERKKNLLQSLEQSEMEAKRIEQYLNQTGAPPPRRSNSTASQRSNSDPPRPEEDAASIDSDFPPTHGESYPPPSAAQGQPQRSEPSSPVHKKTASGNFVTSKIFGRVSHAFQGIVDVDPERTRRDQIGKTKESISQLEQALGVADKDVKDASIGVLRDLKRFQAEKEEDLRRYMIAFAKCHIEWAKRNQASWEEAKAEIQNIQAAPTE